MKEIRRNSNRLSTLGVDEVVVRIFKSGVLVVTFEVFVSLVVVEVD